MQREYPELPLVGVGAILMKQGRVLLIKRGKPPLEGGQRIDREPCAQGVFDVGDDHPSHMYQLPGEREPFVERRDFARAFERILRRDQPPDVIELQPLERFNAHIQMPSVGGIE